MKILFTILILLSFSNMVIGQTGIYRFNSKSGASCTIAITSQKSRISAEIFAWWHTASGRQGTFTGEGRLENNNSILKSVDDADCQIRLTFSHSNLIAKFDNCMNSNLPDDFSGNYQKLSDNLPGEYRVATDKAYFYKSPGPNASPTYLIKGNKVTIDLENIADGQWVFINFVNAAGKNTNGYIHWSDLKSAK